MIDNEKKIAVDVVNQMMSIESEARDFFPLYSNSVITPHHSTYLISIVVFVVRHSIVHL